MSEQHLPQAVFDTMMQSDHFSKWMGMELLEIQAGYCKLRMQVRDEMLNGFGIVHGGISFSLADSALAFASNSHGRLSVSIQATMSYTNPAKAGDLLIAEAKELHLGNKTATYEIQVRLTDNTPVALLQGTVYRTSKQVIQS